MKKTILVTGGLGFIGSHTVVELFNSGYDVIIVDDLSNTSIEVLQRIEKIVGNQPEFIQLDIKDQKGLRKITNENNIWGIIHFAAYKAVGESVSDPLKYYRNNLVTTLNLLELMGEQNIDHLVFSSSATVYGYQTQFPIREDAPIQKAENPYGNTKKINEEIINDFCNSNSNIKAIALRYFNPIGAHASGLIGERPQGIPNNIMPYITQTASGKREQLTVFGDDYDTTDGTGVRDYIHVVDLAKAHVAALDYLQEKNNGVCEFFNVGTGKGISVLELIKAFEKINDLSLNYIIGPRRPGDVPTCYADPTLIYEKLQWKAEYSLDDMVRTAWLFEQNQNKA